MPSRNELGNALLECMREIGALLEHASAVAIEEQDALVKGDAERITLCCKAQEEILRRIGEADQRAAAVATQLAELAGLDEETTDPETLAEAAGYPYTELLKSQMSAISKLSQNVQGANEINGKLLENGMDIITSCLRTLATEPQPPAYSSDANLTPSEVCILSLDRRA